MTPFLGVARSATGLFWTGPSPGTDRRALALAQRTGLPDAVCRILAAREIAPEAAEGFLAPRLRDLMPDPSRLADMDTAAERLCRAVTDARRIALLADYDVDGAAAAALLIRWLRGFGIAPGLHVPDRLTEGYGPSRPAMERLAAGHDLILCLDCGTVAHEPVAAARAMGAEVLIIDHHLPADTLPDAPIVNPNRAEDTSGQGGLCAAGVVFLLLVAANRILRGEGRETPDLMATLDLVALATIADVAPLTGLNRAFVQQGLRVMARRGNPGLAALSDAARLRAAPSAHSLGYALGPRINAGGRVGTADLGTRLLATDDPAEAAALSARLDALNRDRRAIEAQVLDAATAQAEGRGTDGPLVWAAGEGWHPGVIGIVAARLREAFDRPALVVALEGAEGKGSGRSVPGIDLGGAVGRMVAEGLLVKGGGHLMAAGLTVEAGKLDPAMERLGALLAAQGATGGAAPELAIDAVLAAAGATPELLSAIEAAGPFGASAPAPRFAVPGLIVAHARPMGQAHLALRCTDPSGATLEAVAFRALPGPLGDFLTGRAGRPVHLAGRLELDDWNGRRRVRLVVEDAAEADAARAAPNSPCAAPDEPLNPDRNRDAPFV